MSDKYMVKIIKSEREMLKIGMSCRVDQLLTKV